jgi:hypothetical protein
MRRKLTVAAALSVAAVLGVVAIAGATATSIGPSLEFSLDTSLAPKKLPRSSYAPVTAVIEGKVAMSDGSHPSALREIETNIDRNVKVNAKSLPVCRRSQANGSAAGRKACKAAAVGSGNVRVEIGFLDAPPIRLGSRATVFNGGEAGGKAKLLVQTANTSILPASALIAVTIQRNGGGLQLTAEIPRIAGGAGSLLDFELELGRTYAYKGKKVGYLEARCPTGAFETTTKALFRNEANVPSVAPTTTLQGRLSVPCTPTG